MKRTIALRDPNHLMKPRYSILDKAFEYRPSHQTDIRKTFERVRMDQEAALGARVVPVGSVDRRYA
jgi:hypothetical protein